MWNITPRQFQWAVIAATVYFYFVFFMFYFELVEYAPVEKEITKYNYRGAWMPSSLIDVYWYGSWIVLLANCLGLIFYWRLSRWILLGWLLFETSVQPTLGLLVVSGVEYAAHNMMEVLIIWILVMSFFSPIANRFTPEKQLLDGRDKIP